MKNLKKLALGAVLLAGLPLRGHSAEIFKNDDLDLFVGGRLQSLGELSYTADDSIRDKMRIYLFNPESRLMTSGDFKGYKWNFEVAFGGEAINSSNNQLNLKEFNVDIPLIQDMAYVKVGQFKVPTNLESAVYDGNQLFTEKSLLYNMFFNTGYDNGLSLYGHLGQMDFAGGVLSGAPNLPQRYLPEIFQFPPLTFLRVGFNDGITSDPFHQLATGFTKPTQTQFAAHVNGMFVNDSNAGHSTDQSLESGYTGTFSANGDYGNMMLYTLWNPYLGKTAANFGAVNAQYWTASLDTQLRAPLGDTTLTLSAQVNVSQFTAKGFAPVTINGVAKTSGSINIGGGEVTASVGDNPFELAGRFAVVVPDKAFQANTAGTTYATLTGSQPIYELTLPSITWHLNEDVKLVGEALWMINTPEVLSNDGLYLLSEMPSQAASGTVKTGSLVPAGRMMFQFQF
ncbi:MAG TPA: porin [bacterium]|nr:porin [bacterium]